MMTLIELARKLRSYIEKAAESLDDKDAIEAIQLYPKWSGDSVSYDAGSRVRYESELYRCLMSHVSQDGWGPVAAPSLWAKVLIPDDGTIPEWMQPESTNPYMTGDRVMHNGQMWQSEVDNNVWEPGSYGWVEVS